MAKRIKETLSKAHKAAIRESALKRHAARKAAGLPTTFGTAYVKAPDPATPKPVEPPVVVAAKPVVPPVVVATEIRGVFTEKGFVPGPPPVSEPNPAYTTPAVSPRDAFKLWLRSPKGRDVLDTRLSQDPVRLGAEIEDRVFIAWQAGYEEGRQG